MGAFCVCSAVSDGRMLCRVGSVLGRATGIILSLFQHMDKSLRGKPGAPKRTAQGGLSAS
jgi:hypothetical protein